MRVPVPEGAAPGTYRITLGMGAPRKAGAAPWMADDARGKDDTRGMEGVVESSLGSGLGGDGVVVSDAQRSRQALAVEGFSGGAAYAGRAAYSGGRAQEPSWPAG